MKRSWIIIGVIVLIVIIGYSSCKNAYNNLVKKSQDTQSKWAQVESQYQRRTDLYNAVVKTIQGSAAFEQSTLTAVMNASSSS